MPEPYRPAFAPYETFSLRPGEPVREIVLERPPPRPQQRWGVPLVLYVATAASTFLAGGPVFAAWLMGILTAHELGHYFQARRYGVPASLPYFLPMPFSALGTMGAVIVMRSRFGNRRALFDIGITGPLAGLVPALAATIIGLGRSRVVSETDAGLGIQLGEPLLFQLFVQRIIGVLPEGQTVVLDGIAFAGWVGIFLTALNLVPIGQLDGGHVLYALLRRRAHFVSRLLMLAAVVGIVAGGYWQWALMVGLLLAFGIRHPPTANDAVPLGAGRVLLGWLTLSFLILGLTPEPFILPAP